MKLLFMDPKDVKLTVGRLRFGAHALHEIGPAEGLPEKVIIGAAIPTGERIECYGWQNDQDKSWRILRCTSRDMVRFDDVEVVHEEKQGAAADWLGMTVMARHGDGTLWLWRWARGKPSHALYAYNSADGRTWARAQQDPVFHDHDSNGILWDERTQQFINYQATYQPWRKRYEDNIGSAKRRVMHIRTSADGLHWEPSEDVGFGGPFVPEARLFTPDAEDPDEVELYRMMVFPYGDRCVGMQLNYAPSPQEVNPRMQKDASKHGPHLETEWWVSRDGFQWDRPHRGLHASGPSPGHIWHSPVLVDGTRRFFIGGGCYGYDEDRLFYVESRANAEFCTVPFTMPSGGLRLNACTRGDYPEGSAFSDQSYVMAELLDGECKPIEGYEPTQCAFQGVDGSELELKWGERSAADLAGQRVHLRFYMRMARIYAVTSA